MIAMKKSFAYVMLLLVLLLGSFWGGAWYNQRGAGQSHDVQGGRRILYYVDPMNPSHTSDKPGFAPCGMALEPVYADEEATGKDSAGAAVSMSPGTVKLSYRKQQMIGVQVGTVDMVSETHTIRTLGRVAPDENRVYRILAGADGWMWDVRESTTGSLVQKDQLMGTLYNYLFLAREQQYLYALGVADRRQQSGAQSSGTKQPEEQQPGAQQQYIVPLASYSMVQTNEGGVNPAGGVYYINDPLELAKLELYNLGAGDYQLQEIARTRQISTNLEIRSPVTGIVLARNVSPQQRFEKGAELFRVADINRVWIVADVYEREAQYIRPGIGARVSLPHRGKVFEAKVSDVLSQFDAVTRTLKVRLETDNPELVLRPDMFVDVEFQIVFPPAMTVTADAILDSGLRKTVFVDLGNGLFEPRTVETGWRFGDRVEILKGLTQGENIVISGNFLIDSESRMKLAAAGLSGTPAKDPVCGTEVYPGKAKAAGLETESEGKTHYFCSRECKDRFDKEHAHSVEKPKPVRAEKRYGALEAPGKQNMHGFVKDPVCEMLIDGNKAKAEGMVIEYEEKTYHFCSGTCRGQFLKAPGRYAQKASRSEARHAASTSKGEQND